MLDPQCLADHSKFSVVLTDRWLLLE